MTQKNKEIPQITADSNMTLLEEDLAGDDHVFASHSSVVCKYTNTCVYRSPSKLTYN